MDAAGATRRDGARLDAFRGHAHGFRARPSLSGSHSASLTSAGETFTFTDKPEDVWGVVSAGVNFFNFASNTAVFAKVDVTFGDDLDGVGGKAGMRVAW